MFNRKIISALALFLTVAAVLIYRRGEPVREVRPIGTPQTIATPLGLPPVPVPADNPITVEKVALGKRLFFDMSLSIDKSVSCAMCHDPDHGGGRRERAHIPDSPRQGHGRFACWPP